MSDSEPNVVLPGEMIQQFRVVRRKNEHCSMRVSGGGGEQVDDGEHQLFVYAVFDFVE